MHLNRKKYLEDQDRFHIRHRPTRNDIQEAMDFLSTKKGVDEFVLIGLCSGADDAHSVAVLDSRISGAVFLDGYGYRTWGYYLHHYGPRLFKLRVWKNFLKRKYFSVFVEKSEDGDETNIKEEMFERDFPPKEKVTEEIQGLINRGLNLLYIYSGGMKSHYYNYHGQFKDMFRSIDFNGKVQLEYFSEADHTYTRLADREKLMTTISDWMQIHYKAAQFK